MSMPCPYVIRVVQHIGVRGFLAHVAWDTGPETLRGVLAVTTEAVVNARMGNRRPFVDELGRELCRVGMHWPACGCARGFTVRVTE
jgi:hypothetical protein